MRNFIFLLRSACVPMTMLAPPGAVERRYVLAQVYGNSLAIFEARSPWRLAEQQPLPAGYRLRQVVGTLDFTLGPNRDFHNHLDALGIAHHYIELPNVSHSPP